MYPRNAASPPRIAIGAVIQISDGAVQSSGVSVVVRPEGGSETAGGGTVSYGASSSVVYYAPTQAETDYTAFVVTAYKTGCIPVSVTVITTASSTAGKVDVSHFGGTGVTGRDIGASVLLSSGTGTGQVKLSSGYIAPNWGDVGNPTTVVGLTGTTISTTQAVASVSGNVGGNVVGSVASVVGSVGSISGVTFPTNFGDLAITVTTGRVTVGTNADKTGYSISGTTTTFDALQTALNSAHGSGSWATATGFSTHSAADVWAVATRTLTAFAFSVDISAAGVDSIWDEATSGHTTSGTTGKALTDAGSAGDPWTTALPGSYTSGQAGYILGTNLNATVSSRSTVAATDIVSGGAITTSGGVAASDIISISGDATAANNLEAILDGTGGTGLTLSTLTVTAGVTVTQSTTDGHGISVTGNGSGNALYLLGGATGDGIHTAAGATSGYGIHVTGVGVYSGIYVQGGVSGDGVTVYGGASGGYAMNLVSQGGGNAGLSITTNAGYAIDASGGILATTNAIAWNPAWDAEVQSEANDALVAIGLDHLVSASVAGTDITDNSIVAKLASKSATADWDSYDNTTDSLQAIRDQGDSAWITATGFATSAALATAQADLDILTGSDGVTLATSQPNYAPAVVGDIPTAAANADAVWDEARTGHTTSGTFGFYIDAAISGISGGGGDATAANQSTIITHLTDIKGATWSSSTDTLELLANAIAALPSAAAIWAAITNAAANKIADHILRRPLASARASSDGDTVAFRSALGALAKLVNKLERTGGHLYTFEEDDTTPFGDQTVGEDANANPITSLDTN